MAQGAAARGSTPPLVHKWEARLGIEVAGYFLQRMKTKWGGAAIVVPETSASIRSS